MGGIYSPSRINLVPIQIPIGVDIVRFSTHNLLMQCGLLRGVENKTERSQVGAYLTATPC